MKRFLKVIGVTGLMAGMLIVGGCGSGGDGGNTIPVVTPPVAQTLTPTGANTEPADASTLSTTIDIALTSTYTFNVSGFAAGDKIVFPAGTAIDLMNINGADRVIDVTGSLNGNAVTVHLTGVAVASDGSIFGVNSFNTVFGAGSLTTK